MREGDQEACDMTSLAHSRTIVPTENLEAGLRTKTANGLPAIHRAGGDKASEVKDGPQYSLPFVTCDGPLII
jgi:hypothetical protein